MFLKHSKRRVTKCIKCSRRRSVDGRPKVEGTCVVVVNIGLGGLYIADGPWMESGFRVHLLQL